MAISQVSPNHSQHYFKPEKPPTGNVEFSYNPQDQTVLSAGTAVVSGVRPGPSVDGHVIIRQNRPEPRNGRYVYSPNEAEYHAATVFAAADKAISLWDRALGGSLNLSSRLELHADEGEGLNAHFSAGNESLNFSHYTDPVTHKTIFTGDSGEVVAHEAGHGVLHHLRPTYLTAFSPDPGAFHESFGDVTAMLVAMTDDRVLQKMTEQTGGDLRKPNLVAQMGEELGITINHVKGRNVTGGDYVRTAINSFTWSDPAQLPAKTPYDQLSSEVHSYSRLFTGAVYDVLTGMVDQRRASGTPAKEAIRASAEELTRLYGGLLTTAPQGNFAYRDMANALLEADRKVNQGARQDLLTQVFTQRQILGAPTLAALLPSDGPVSSVTTTLDGPEFGRFQGAEVSQPSSGALGLTSAAEESALRQDLQNLIRDGRVLYTEPGQAVSRQDLLDGDGNPYIGVVRWLDGKMTIERVDLLA